MHSVLYKYLMKRLVYLLGVVFVSLGLGIAACEPLAPTPNSQAVIVITNTPTAVVVSVTPLLSTPLPSPVTPTATFLASISTARPTMTPTPTVLPSEGENNADLPPCEATEGLSFDSAFESIIAGEPIRYRIYLPPCFYETGRRYPYVILLHGSSYNYTQWDEEVGIVDALESALQDKDNAIAPMVLIMPDGGVLQELNDYTNGPLWEQVILTELIPYIESSFCVWNAPEGRAIGGISRGGFWAVSIGLRNPSLFTSIGGHSPAFFEDNAPPEYNPLALADVVTTPLDVRIYLDIARSDVGVANFSRFVSILSGRNIPHIAEVSPSGDHTDSYWASQVENYLRFYSEPWPTDPAALPSCFS
ncbi:MAG: hypothetical protein CUN55_02025 [Phototrophicales bacterium]|nr:MAG: hypothetical protein CUN55_02025 [Phototrophicales bacterium]